MTAKVADEWGRVIARCEAGGRPLAAMDGLIASTVIVHGLTLFTRNTSDFETALKSLVNLWKKGRGSLMERGTREPTIPSEVIEGTSEYEVCEKRAPPLRSNARRSELRSAVLLRCDERLLGAQMTPWDGHCRIEIDGLEVTERVDAVAIHRAATAIMSSPAP